MSLFDLQPGPKQSPTQFALETNAPAEYFNAASIRLFKHWLGAIKHNHHYHFSTGGQWSMHELMIYLLGITGPAYIWKSTWAISEEPVRAIIDLKKKGVILRIKCIFDYKVKEQKSRAFHLAQENFDQVTLAKCHAKVMVIQNDQWAITVAGSANDTRNPRIERGVICSVAAVAQADIGWMEAVMNGEKPFKVR